MPRVRALSWHDERMASKKPAARRFGSIRELPSGRYQARFVGPDGQQYKAPRTYGPDELHEAEAFLAAQRKSIKRAHDDSTDWRPPGDAARGPGVTFGTYAAAWLATHEDARKVDRPHAPRTTALYRSLLRLHILPTFGDIPLGDIDRHAVREWYADLDTGPTARANAYGLLRTVMADAVDREVIPANPVQVKGAGSKRRARDLRVLTLAELDALVAVIPARYRALILLGAWCGLRFGELAALRRRDLDLDAMTVRIEQALNVVGGKVIISRPKAGSVRTVDIPGRPELLAALETHLSTYSQPGRDGLVFPAANGREFLQLGSLHRVFGTAKRKAGRPDVRPHDLRHFGAIMAARAGATLGELQHRLGHKTAQAALVYQSAASERNAEIARRMAALSD